MLKSKRQNFYIKLEGGNKNNLFEKNFSFKCYIGEK